MMAETEVKAQSKVEEPAELVSDSEYHTASEFQPEFHSDNEPPEDKLIETKIIVKHNNLRVYKQILKIGKGLFMPAKYDKIEYRVRELDEESVNPRSLDDIEPMQGQMGSLSLIQASLS